MSDAVDFVNVSIVGLESSPVAGGAGWPAGERGSGSPESRTS
jgi:hypothetical protein